MLVSSGVSACAINYAGSNVAPRIVEDTAFVWVCGNSFTSGPLRTYVVDSYLCLLYHEYYLLLKEVDVLLI